MHSVKLLREKFADFVSASGHHFHRIADGSFRFSTPCTLSFTNWNLTSGWSQLLSVSTATCAFSPSHVSLHALGRTFSFTVFAVAIEVVLGVAIDFCLNRDFFRQSFAKLLLLLPLVATPVAVGIVFNLFYDPTIGLLNFRPRRPRATAGSLDLERKHRHWRRWSWSMSGSGRP